MIQRPMIQWTRPINRMKPDSPRILELTRTQEVNRMKVINRMTAVFAARREKWQRLLQELADDESDAGDVVNEKVGQDIEDGDDAEHVGDGQYGEGSENGVDVEDRNDEEEGGNSKDDDKGGDLDSRRGM
jgi:hypothetical protein